MRRLILSKMFFSLLVIFSLASTVHAASVVDSPFSNQTNTAVSEAPFYEMDTNILGGTLSDTAQILSLHSTKKGYHAGVPSISTEAPFNLTFTPNEDFFAGEKIRFGFNNIVSEPYSVTPYISEFFTEVSPDSPAYFVNSEIASVQYGMKTILHDMDNDGDLDLSVMQQPPAESHAELFLNNGSGTFMHHSFFYPFSKLADISSGDLDKNGELDYCMLSATDNKVYTFKNIFSLVSYTEYDTNGSSLQAMELGDLNGDGYLDLFVAANGQNEVLMNVSGTLTNSAIVDFMFYDSRDVALGDLDNDGDLDAVIANYLGYNQIYENDGFGSFTEVMMPSSLGYAYCVELADFNGDGLLDIFYGNYDNEPNEIWLNTGEPFTSIEPPLDGSILDDIPLGPPTIPFMESGQYLGDSDSRDASIGDMDGDGDLDIIVANNNEAEVLWLNDGTGTFSQASFEFPVSFNRGVDVGDVNGDGTLDVAFANFSTSGSPIWLNKAIEPIVTTNTPVSDITSTSVTASGEVTDFGGAIVTARGIVYSTNTGFDVVSGTMVADLSGGVGSFSVSLSNLDYGTTYYYRAYGTNSVGVGVGDEYSFTTDPEPQSITFDALADREYGESFDLTGTATSGLFVSYVSSDTSVATISGATVTVVGVGQTTITASQPGNFAYYPAISVDQVLTTVKATPVLTGVSVSGINYLQYLSDSTISLTATNSNNSATVTGSVAFDVPSTQPTVPDSMVTEYAFTFTPGDTANYNNVTGTVTLVVSPLAPELTWYTPLSLTDGDTLSSMELDATANTAGTFTYTPVEGTLLAVGRHDLSASFVSQDPNYTDGTITQYIYVNVPSVPDNLPPCVHVTVEGAGSFSGDNWENACAGIIAGIARQQERVPYGFYLRRTTINKDEPFNKESLFKTMSKKAPIEEEEGPDENDLPYTANVFAKEGIYQEGEPIVVPFLTSLWGGFTGQSDAIWDPSMLDTYKDEGYATILDGQNMHQVVINQGQVNCLFIENGQLEEVPYFGYLDQESITKEEAEKALKKFSDKYSSNSKGDIPTSVGAGLYNVDGYAFFCTIRNNRGGEVGAGVVNDYGNIFACEIYNNGGSFSAGGVYNIEGMISNSLIMKNTAQFGGGVMNAYGAIENCTITENFASICGGIMSGEDDLFSKRAKQAPIGSVQNAIVNTIIYGNHAITSDMSENLVVTYSDMDATIAYCCLGDPITDTMSEQLESVRNSIIEEGNIYLDPLFYNIQTTDPANWDLSLQAESPCIDTGLADSLSFFFPYDKDYTNRQKGISVDMGAYEFNHAPTGEIVIPETDQSVPHNQLTFDFSGTAHDTDFDYLGEDNPLESSISLVQYRNNGGEWMDADGTENWSFTANLQDGQNLIEVQAFDITLFRVLNSEMEDNIDEAEVKSGEGETEPEVESNIGDPIIIGSRIITRSANAAPTLTLVDPSADQSVAFNQISLNFSGTAADNDGTITEVTYRLNGGAWAVATGTDSWNFSQSLVLGENRIDVRSMDNATDFGAAENSYSAISTLIITRNDNVVPTVTITDPTSNQSVPFNVESFVIQGISADADGLITDVEYRTNGSKWTSLPSPESWNTAINLDPGLNTFEVRSIDNSSVYGAAQNAESAIASIRIMRQGNQAPTGSISAPTGPETVAFNVTTFDFNGIASDSDGAVTAIDYRVNSGSWIAATGTDGWSFTAPLSAGDNIVEVRATDNGSSFGGTNATSIIGSITITRSENTDPMGVIEIPTGNETVAFNVTTFDFSGSASDSDGAVTLIDYRVNGGSWIEASGFDNWAFTAALVEGANVVEVRATDNGSSFGGTNATAIFGSITITRTANVAPIGGIITPTGNETVAFNVTTFDFSGSATDSDGAVTAIDYRMNGGTWMAATGTDSWAFTADLVEGANVVEVRATDNGSSFGGANATAIIGSVTITRSENADPMGVIEIPTGNETVAFNVTTFDFSGSATDSDGAVTLIDYRVNGGSWIEASGFDNWAFTAALVEGANVVEVRATDNGSSFGGTNASAIFGSITITRSENVAPTGGIEMPTGNETVAYNVTTSDFSGTSADSDGEITAVEYRVNGGSWTPTTGIENWTFTANLIEGDNVVEVRATDNASVFGGSDATSPLGTITIIRLGNEDATGSIDMPTGNQTVAFNVTTFDFSGTAADSDGAVTAIDYRLNGGSWMPATGIESWSFTAGLIEGDNVVIVRATDDAAAYGAEVNKRTPLGTIVITRSANVAPTGAIVTPAMNTSVVYNETTFDFNGTATDSDGAVTAVEYRVNGGSWVAAIGADAWTFTAADLEVGENTVEVRALDNGASFGAAANARTTIGTVTITRQEKNAPTVTVISPEPVTTQYPDPQTPFVFTGTASDEDGEVVRVEYRINSGEWITATGTEEWSFEFTLEDAGNYYIFTRAIDDSEAEGNGQARLIELLPVPIVDFESNTPSIEEDNEILFYDLSTGALESWAWDFDNDGNIDSTEQNPTWIYEDPGLYSVTLTVFDGLGEATLTKEEYISVFPTDAPEYDSEVVSFNIPATMNQFNEYVGTVTLRNTGWITWLDSHMIYLGTQELEDGLIIPRFWRVDIPNDIRFGETVTFTMRFKPQYAGTFTTQWQMVYEETFWFGEEVEEEVRVDRTTDVSSQQWNLYK